MKRRIKFYLLTLLLLVLAIQSIQVRRMLNTTLQEEEVIEDRTNTAICRAFGTIAKEDSPGIKATECAILGKGAYELRTAGALTNLDSMIRKELGGIDEIQLPFQVTLTTPDKLQPWRVDQAPSIKNNASYQLAHVDLAIPTWGDFFVEQIETDVVLSLVFLCLIGGLFINLFKSVNQVQMSPYQAKNDGDDIVFHIGKYIFDFKNQELCCDQQIRRITEKESQILRFLCSNKRQIVRRDQILTELWGESDYFNGRSLDVFIARLRKYLSKDRNIQIESIYGVGFVLNDE